MNKPNIQNASNDAGHNADQSQKSGSVNSPTAVPVVPPVPGIVQPVTPAVKEPSAPAPAQDVTNPPLAAKGDDSLMSQQQKSS